MGSVLYASLPLLPQPLLLVTDGRKTGCPGHGVARIRYQIHGHDDMANAATVGRREGSGSALRDHGLVAYPDHPCLLLAGRRGPLGDRRAGVA